MITDHEFIKGPRGRCDYVWYTYGSGTEMERCHLTEEQHAASLHLPHAEQEAVASDRAFIPLWLDPESPSKEDKQMTKEPEFGSIQARVFGGKVWVAVEDLINCLDLSYDLQMETPNRPGTWMEGSLAALSHVTGNIRYLYRKAKAASDE